MQPVSLIINEAVFYISFILSLPFIQVLCNLYTKTLSILQQMPREAAYRRQTEQIVQQRLQIVQAESNIPSIESKIGCGQVEELIDQVGVRTKQ